jgi:cephalosporin hydroxylase
MNDENKYLEENMLMTLREWLLYHQNNLHFNQKYRGIQMIKNPFDMIIYEELMFEIRPSIIIEIGTSQGGFSLWLADRMKMISQKGRIITMDLNDIGKKNLEKFDHKNIIPFVGDCNSPEIIRSVCNLITKDDIVMIIEDSSHTFENTKKTLENYKDLVSVGSYFVIEDGICDLLDLGISPGPMKAVESWILENTDYEIDRSKEKYILTYNPKGYLRRIK